MVSKRPYPACSGSFTAAKVRLLATGGFNFHLNGMTSPDDATYMPPQLAPDQSPISNYKNLLDEAYGLAPSWLQTALCRNVDVVYVDQDSHEPLGWSYWEVISLGQSSTTPPDPNNPAVGSGKGVYIAVNQKILDDTNATIDKLEARDLRALLTTGYKDVVRDVAVTDTQVNPSNVDTRAKAVLLILAREMGFVTEHELAVQSTPPAVPKCNGSTFYSYAPWTGDSGNPPPAQPDLGRVHRLGDATLGIKPNRQGFIVENIIKRIATPHAGLRGPTAISDMKNIYGPLPEGVGTFNPAWADLLATEAPIEDFVETYKLVALADSNTKITSIVLQYPDNTSSYNILDNLKTSGSTLLSKANCLIGVGGLIGQLQPLQ